MTGGPPAACLGNSYPLPLPLHLASLESSPRHPLRCLACPMVIVGVAIALRLLVLVALDPARAAVGASAWEWGAEQACLADSLLRGQGFGDPWAQGSGPSAWLTPIYPALLAACMKIGGGVSALSGWCLFGLQSVLDGCTAWLLLRLGRHLRRPLAGIAAAWFWVVYPLAVWHATHTVWDTTLVACVMTLFLERFAALGVAEQGAPASRTAVAGLFFGLLLFTNPAPQSIAPVVLLALLAGGPGRPLLDPRRLGRAALFALATLAVCLPWIARNQRVLGTLQLRPNFGVEMMIGNHDLASGHPEPFKYHPSHIAQEQARYRQLGEVAYSQDCMQRALEWIRSEPRAFAALTAKRCVLFWVGRPPTHDPRQTAGVGAAGDPKSWLKWVSFLLAAVAGWAGLVWGGLRARERVFAALLLLSFGLPYYISHVSERYRFPIDPLLILGLGLLVTRRREARNPVGLDVGCELGSSS